MENESKMVTTKIPCKGCGSAMVYSAKTQSLECVSCGSTEAIQTNNDKIIEQNYSSSLNIDEKESGMGLETKNFHCNTCGAVTMVDPQTVTFACSFCGSENVNEDSHKTKIIRPQGLLPFKMPQEKAYQIFKEWIGGGWFHPNSLKKVTRLDKINGVYVPFWTYDAYTESNWYAEAGYHYYETEHYTDSEGNSQTRQVQRTNWVPASGYYEYWFDDVTVIASQGITQARIQQVYPFALGDLVNYDSQFLVGWKSELYHKDVNEGFKIAEGIMEAHIEAECIKQIPGDTHRFLEVHTNKRDLTFKHILLPIWIAAYTFNGKTYQVVVNGTTGKISGEKPYSWIKITIFIIFLISIGLIIYGLTQNK